MEKLIYSATGQLGICGITTEGKERYIRSFQYQLGQLHVEEDKQSNDEGEFVPGIYRVNPYYIASGEHHMYPYIGASFEALPCMSIYYYGDSVYIAQEADVYIPEGYSQPYALHATIVGEWWRPYFLAKADEENPLREAEDYEQLSLQKAYTKLGDSDLDLGEVLGEYRETIKTLTSPLSSLRKFLWSDKARNMRLLFALMKGDKRTVARLLGRTGIASADTMASTWLELRYGIRPLVMLAQEIIERAQESHDQLFDPMKIRSVRTRLKYTNDFVVKPTVSYGKAAARGDVLIEDQYESSASVQYTLSAPPTFLGSLGLTPQYLPELAWELTTCSFVWDWILSIGPWLGTLRYNPDLIVLGNTSGFKRVRKCTLRQLQVMNTDVGKWREVKDCLDTRDEYENSFTYSSYRRVVDLDLEYIPHFTWGRTLDIFKAIDSVSLIWTRLVKPGRNHRK